MSKDFLVGLSFRKTTFCRPVTTICETGFNLGHSAISWLGSLPNATLYSFDLGAHPYVRVGEGFVKQVFPNRLHLTLGDSTVTVPQFFEQHSDIKCDVVFIDGGHTYQVATADLENLSKRLTKHGVIVIDDTNCHGNFCTDAAWKDFLSRNKHRFSPLRIDLLDPVSGISAAFAEEEQ